MIQHSRTLDERIAPFQLLLDNLTDISIILGDEFKEWIGNLRLVGERKETAQNKG